MSYTVTSISMGNVPTHTPLAMVKDGDVFLWPGGLGVGPMMVMSISDWETLRNSADAAIAVAITTSVVEGVGGLFGYTACEGNGVEG